MKYTVQHSLFLLFLLCGMAWSEDSLTRPVIALPESVAVDNLPRAALSAQQKQQLESRREAKRAALELKLGQLRNLSTEEKARVREEMEQAKQERAQQKAELKAQKQSDKHQKKLNKEERRRLRDVD